MSITPQYRPNWHTHLREAQECYGAIVAADCLCPQIDLHTFTDNDVDERGNVLCRCCNGWIQTSSWVLLQAADAARDAESGPDDAPSSDGSALP